LASVILLRHGETALNRKVGASTERIRGWVDVPLDKNGQKQAVELGVRYGNEPISKVYSTDFQRGRVVAENIARTAHAAGNPVPLIAAQELRPWNLGILHGKEVDKVIPVMNKCVENPDVQVPDGESFDSYKNRYLPFLAGLLKEASTSRGNIVAVTHSRNLQLARAWDKAGRQGTNYDLDRMLDYKDEVPPGQHIELKP
jgi:broad specificity phosphatase PhoE